MNANSPPEALAVLALDRNVKIRLEAAKNLNTPSEVVDDLIADSDSKVRRTAAASLAARERIGRPPTD